MATLQVELLQFTFSPTVAAERYDTWHHYINVWNTAGRNQKAVDIVAVGNAAAPATAWLIEAKDFRVVYPSRPPRPSNLGGLPETVAAKVEHTLAGLADAASNAAMHRERDHATAATAAPTKRVVLHLEPHTGPHTALFPSRFDASVLQKLRLLVRHIDPNPLVLRIANTAVAGVPWTTA
jgi:hypothetical protein